MSTKLPDHFMNLIKTNPTRVLVQEFPPSPKADDCKNCAGIGKVYVFQVEDGPSRYPMAVKAGSVLKSITDEMYGYVWYSGKTQAATCPVCNGTGSALRARR